MIFFRCDVSDKIGWGHLKRCLILAKTLGKYTKTCFLISDSSPYVCEAIKESGASLHVLPKNLKYEEEIQYYPEGSRNIIVDMGYRENLCNPKQFLDYLHALKRAKYQVAIMDGLGDDAFRNENAPIVKAYIQPYWGVLKEEEPSNTENWIYGAEYVLLDDVYRGSYKRRDDAPPRKILVTFGGSDPQENTIKVLNGLVKKVSGSNIRVVVGPSFSSEHIEKIEALKVQYKIDVIQSPENLFEHYQWADIGVCASGMTRYEAAACGLPIIFTSIYPEHERLSERFASFGTAQYIGLCTKISSEEWSTALSRLQSTPKLYISMLNSIEKMQQKECGALHLSKALLKVFDYET